MDQKRLLSEHELFIPYKAKTEPGKKQTPEVGHMSKIFVRKYRTLKKHKKILM